MARTRARKNKTGEAKKPKPESRMVSRVVGAYANPGSHTTLMRSNGPSMRSINNGRGLVISNTEKGNGISMNSGGNTYLGISFNPAEAAVFPWLAPIARSYSMYRWKKFIVSYVPTAATTVSGSVELASFYEYRDFNAWFTSPGNLSTQAQYSFGPPYAGGAISSDQGSRPGNDFFGIKYDVVNAHRKVPWFNVQKAPSGTAEINQSIALFLASTAYGGSATANGVGSLFYSYEIELIEPSGSAYDV